jgi:hypothetical protein
MRGRVRRRKSWGSPPPLCDLVGVGDRRYPWTMPFLEGLRMPLLALSAQAHHTTHHRALPQCNPGNAGT